MSIKEFSIFFRKFIKEFILSKVQHSANTYLLYKSDDSKIKYLWRNGNPILIITNNWGEAKLKKNDKDSKM